MKLIPAELRITEWPTAASSQAHKQNACDIKQSCDVRRMDGD